MLDLEDVSVSYSGGANSLNGVGIHISAGEFVAVLGNNGAGKTTLLRTISRTLPMFGATHTSGRICLDGKDVTRFSSSEMVRMGVVQSPEGRGIFANLTVHENLRMGGFIHSRKSTKNLMGEVYDLFPDLVSRKDHKAGLLSGGQQQMLAVARALLASPRVLLLDEPSLGLAPKIVEHVGQVLRQVHQNGTAILLVEQNAAMALNLADRAYVFELGTVAKEGVAKDLARDGAIKSLYLGGSSKEISRDGSSKIGDAK